MLSSTSSSSERAIRTAIAILLACLVAYFAALEVAARVVLPRLSEGQRRQSYDHEATRTLMPVREDGARTVLIVGNSLLLDGVDRESLQEQLRPQFDVIMYPIEGTTYWDWWFGLERLLAEGARPASVVLCLSVRHVLSNGTNGEGFAHDLMSMSDLMNVKQASALTTMRTSEYFFANLSAWLGSRVYVRNWLIQKWMPNADRLVAKLTVVDPTPLVAEALPIDTATSRLLAVQDLARSIGAGFTWLVPPSSNPADPAPVVRDAARQRGISVLLPYEPAEMPPAEFYDGFHLDDSGATRFTDRMAVELKQLLSVQLPSS